MSTGSPTTELPRGTADDVALADALADGDAPERGPWACVSWSALDTEEVWLQRVDPGEAQLPLRVSATGRTCFRPAVCALADGALALALAPSGQLFGLRCRDRDREPPRRWELAVAGTPWHAALARDAAGGALWLALEQRHAGARTITLGVLDPDEGTLRELVTLGDRATHARWPALAAAPGGGVVLAWCEGPAHAPARIRVARIDVTRGLRGPVHDADPTGAPGEAPAIAVGATGTVMIAWHTGGATLAEDARDASVRRTLRVARWDLAHDTIALTAPPPAGAGGLEPRGEDQGWELPAIALDGRGALWLAGRSSHGHQLARLDADGAWSARLALCRDNWGGRGRRMALVGRSDEIWLGRRGPDGLDVRSCPDPGPAVPAIALATPARPARVRPAASARPAGILFGDLHQHTAHSDGCGSAEELWIAARDIRGLDFAAITDHDKFCGRALGPASWAYLCQLANDHDDPGRFAAFSAYEFTGPRHPGPGHKCIYFGDRVPARVPDKDVDAIFAMCRELGALAVPHHVGWTGGDFAHHDPALQPVWEICSVHGCYASEHGCGVHTPRADHVIPGQFVKDALDAGLRFGFIGSTDSHGLDWHHGIARWRNPFRSGLACVVGADRTRSSILDAIRARRTYATSGARIGLRVEVDGAPMGSALPAGTRGALVVEVTGTAPIAAIVLVTTAGDHPLSVGPPDAHALVRTPLPAFEHAGGYGYVRVEQADGEMAWGSPIWVG